MTMTAAAPAERTLARIVGPRAEAAERIHAQIEAGLAIKEMRIRYTEDLDEARARKLEWVQQTTDLLTSVFDNSSVADYCNDWVGKIFPEYAEFGNFVEQFYEEMGHRLGRLKAVYKRVEQGLENHAATQRVINTPESAGTPQPPTAPAPAPAAAAAPAAPAPSAAMSVLLVIPADVPQIADPLSKFLSELGVRTHRAGDGTEADCIDALEQHTSAAFALIAPSIGAADASHAAYRLGYCVGKLGKNHLCVVHPGEQATGLEALGLPHLSLDPNGGWQLQLARQLKRAGIAVDLNRLC